MILHQLWSGFRPGGGGGGAPGSALRRAYHLSFKGQSLFAVPMAAFSMATAPRGQKVASGVSAIASGFGSLAGALVGGPVGAIAGGLLADNTIAGGIQHMFQSAHDFERDRVRLQLGGNYQDTQAAYTMRARAAAELSGSLLNARMHLGSEAIGMHS